MEKKDIPAAHESISDALKTIADAVNTLYEYRDQYIATNGLDNAANKHKDVASKLESTLEIIESCKDNFQKTNRCLYYINIGKALNVTPQFNENALEYLSKAVKLDPKLVEAWNCLGECYWKKGDVDSAKNCFLGALNHEKNKVSLRNLSMTLRQLGSNNEEKSKNVEESVKMANEAVKLDLGDGMSWLVLGNAYLTSFFTCGQDPSYLRKCMTAFNKAQKDTIAAGNPDLYYNKGMAFKYEEEYSESLKMFDQASALDPSWKEAFERNSDLISYLNKVQDFIYTKGKMKQKKLESLLNNLNDSLLGPYKDGGYTSKHGQSVHLKFANINCLSDGTNENKVILGRVVCSVYSNNEVPFTFCLVDKESTCVCVTVYNLAQGEGVIIGDSIAIPEPFLQAIKFSFKENEFDFKSIRVSNPLIMVINGKKCGKQKVASSKISINLMSQ